jgi:hypothetical protein
MAHIEIATFKSPRPHQERHTHTKERPHAQDNQTFVMFAMIVMICVFVTIRMLVASDV